MSLGDATAIDVIELPDGGRFEVIRRLAAGGMAEIFLARKAASGGFERVVVLKRILDALSNDAQFVEMFTQEARLAALLVHANVAQVYEMGRDTNGRLFYAMEYVEGRDVRALARSGPLPLEVTLAIIVGAASGLHYAHTMTDPRGAPLHIVHRDVTPANIMVSHAGTVKVVDFGVAKAAMAGREATAAGILKGKIPYMSPEQVAATGDLDARSDVFSLGICLWELTLRKRLFRRANQVEALRAISAGDVPRPTTIDPAYPPELERIVMTALSLDRDERYATAQALQMDLEAFALDHRLPLTATRLQAFMEERFAADRSHDAALQLAGVEALGDAPTALLPGGDTGAGPGAARAASAPTVAGEASDASGQRPADRRRALAGVTVAVLGVVAAIVLAFRFTASPPDAPSIEPSAVEVHSDPSGVAMETTGQAGDPQRDDDPSTRGEPGSSEDGLDAMVADTTTGAAVGESSAAGETTGGGGGASAADVDPPTRSEDPGDARPASPPTKRRRTKKRSGAREEPGSWHIDALLPPSD